jgi:hypothetical protein
LGDRLALYAHLVATLTSGERLIAVRGFRLTSMNDEQRERAYYRAIEDFFAEMRGSPHTLSTKDFQLMRSWWRDEVPMSAVTTGVTEVVNRRRERGVETPVVSLTYCKHAVRRHAKRLAEMSLGHGGADKEEAETATVVQSAVASLGEQLKAVASAQEELRPRVAAALTVLVAHLLQAAELPVAAVEEHLFSLEIAMLEGCRRALDRGEQELVDERARDAANAEDGGGSVFRAMQDREVRRLLDLPRLEIV